MVEHSPYQIRYISDKKRKWRRASSLGQGQPRPRTARFPGAVQIRTVALGKCRIMDSGPDLSHFRLRLLAPLPRLLRKLRSGNGRHILHRLAFGSVLNQDQDAIHGAIGLPHALHGKAGL